METEDHAPRHRYAVDLLFVSIMTIYVLVGMGADHWTALTVQATVVGPLLLWWLPTYTFFAMRRVFQRSWLNTLLKLAAVCATYLLVLSLTLSTVVIYSALES